MTHSEAWYIVKQDDGRCTILPESQMVNEGKNESPDREHWGPYTSQQDAIARRIGLIRAGKCTPA